jgi:voltage-gated potassium channel
MNERAERLERFFTWPVIVAALLVIPVIFIEESSDDEPWTTLAAITNWIVWLVFLAELVAMLYVVPNRWRWLAAHPLEVAVVVLTPPFMPASLQALRVIRLLRLLRLLRLVQMARRSFSVVGLRYAAVLALTTALGGGAAFAAIEEEPETWDGVWWAITTMTTVGYGDVYPQTDGGRVLAMVLMIVGIGFVALLTGAIAERFVAAQVRAEAEAAEHEVVGEIEDAREAALHELRSIAERMQRLESTVQRLGR